MDLLSFARGPALEWSVAIMLVGIVWRLVGVFLLGWRRHRNQARGHQPVKSAVRMMLMRSWPHREFLPRTGFSELVGWTFHLGYFAVLLLFIPHIQFFEEIIGFGWPGLPTGLIYILGVITIAGLVIVLVHRLHSPVLRLISNADDYISWVLTILPLITGFMAAAHFGGRYETLLAIHLLSVEALMIWFPFGKLMHAFFIWPCRGVTGIEFDRKGVNVQ